MVRKMINKWLNKIGFQLITNKERQECSNSYLTVIQQDKKNKQLKKEIEVYNDKLENKKSKIVSLQNKLNVAKNKLKLKKNLTPETYYKQYKHTNLSYNGRVLSNYLNDEVPMQVLKWRDEVINMLDNEKPDHIVYTYEDWLNRKFLKKEFFYRSEKKEHWNPPTETVNNIKNKAEERLDCDDYMVLSYYIIREVFKELKLWNKVKNRLFCTSGNVNINHWLRPSTKGSHAYLDWVADDCEEYTVETTYYRGKSKINFLKKPQRKNTMYGVIWFSFTEDYTLKRNFITPENNEE